MEFLEKMSENDKLQRRKNNPVFRRRLFLWIQKMADFSQRARKSFERGGGSSCHTKRCYIRYKSVLSAWPFFRRIRS